MKAETQSGRTLAANLRGELPGIQLQRIEDESTEGIPDVYFIWRGVSCWVENKHVKALPKRESTLVVPGLSPAQRNWLVAQHEAGGNAFVCVRDVNLGWLLAHGAAEVESLYRGIPLVEWRALPWRRHSVAIARALGAHCAAQRAYSGPPLSAHHFD